MAGKEDDENIEEFDTDEEEENEKPKNPEVSENQEYMKCLSYSGDECIYTEPKTGRKLIWNKEKNSWVDQNGEKVEEKVNETEKSKPQYEFDGKSYVYTDEKTAIKYEFNQDKNEWVKKENSETENPGTSVPSELDSGEYGFEGDTHTYTDKRDGSSYIWDREKNAWFPKIDEDFMARYQMSYGFVDPNAGAVGKEATETEVKKPEEKKQSKSDGKRKEPEPASWFEVDEAHNTSIYISGLPLDITLDEITEVFAKCGLLARDEKGKNKIKLYKDSSGELKGDALCTYIKKESVDLALKILDGYHIRNDVLSVQRAKFQLKGEYDPTRKPKKKKKDKEKQKKIQEKLLDWRPDKMIGEPQKCERVVILKNLFTPSDFDKQVTLIMDYQNDIRSECMKYGEVKKIVLYDRNPEGVAQVTYKEASEADECVRHLNHRWFSQRIITAEIWDGKTKYKVQETDAEIEARINKWEKYLEEQEENESKEEKGKAI